VSLTVLTFKIIISLNWKNKLSLDLFLFFDQISAWCSYKILRIFRPKQKGQEPLWALSHLI